MHTCHARQCSVPVPPKRLFCLHHWNMTPRDIQQEVWRCYRPGQEIDKKPSKEYLVVARRAIEAVWEKEQQQAV